MKKVLVTVGRGYRVITLDDLSTGKLENIEELTRNQTFDFIRGSVTDLARLSQFWEMSPGLGAAMISRLPIPRRG
ncbi:hypothetical protein ACFLWL_01900 [Chloroflexota bacterium]